MNQKILISIVLIVLTVVFLAGLGFFMYKFYVPKNSETVKKTDEQIKLEIQKKVETDYNAQFPDVIGGVINIVSDQKTTIKTEKGIEYLISPARPKSFFSDSHIVNNSSVQVRGKISGTNIDLGSIVSTK